MVLCISAGNFDPLSFVGVKFPWNLENTYKWPCQCNSSETTDPFIDRTSYDVMHIGRKFWSPHFYRSYAPWNLENIRKSTNNLSFLHQFFINEITASDAGPDIIRSHLFYTYRRKCLPDRTFFPTKVKRMNILKSIFKFECFNHSLIDYLLRLCFWKYHAFNVTFWPT